MKRREMVLVGAIIFIYCSGPLTIYLAFTNASPIFLELFGYLMLFNIAIICAFIGNTLLGDPSAREREAKRQIMLESPRVLMPEENNQ